MKKFYSILGLTVLLTFQVATLVSAANRDFYKILGIRRNATPAQIKRAYRKLSMKYHPDKNPGDAKAKQMFTDVAAAKEMLENRDKRRKYDQCGEECVIKAEQEAAAQGAGGHPFGDFFGDFFGGG